MDFSLLILTHNRKEYLQQTLRSVYQQKTDKLGFEVVVIDDGSSDGTKEVIDILSEKIKNLTYVYHEHTEINIAECRNLALRNSSGKIVCFIDSGVILREDFISQHYRMHQGKNAPDVVIGKIIGFEICLGEPLFEENYDPDDIQKTINNISNIEQFEDRRMASYRYFGNSFRTMPTPWHYFWTCNVSWKRTENLKNVCFDEKICNWGMEDVELGYRLYQCGAVFEYNPEAVVVHLPHDTMEDVAKKSVQDNDNLMYFYRKHKSPTAEMYAYARMYIHNESVYNFLEKSEQRLRKVKVASTGIDNNRTIIFGGAELDTENSGIKPVIVDYEDKFNNLKAENHISGFGAVIECDDSAFDKVIIWDYWDCINSTFLWSVLKEAVRIGTKVYILISAEDNNGESLFNVCEEKKIDLRNILLIFKKKYKEITTILSDGMKLHYIQTI